MKPPAYDRELRSVTTRDGKAVKLSPVEMALYHTLAHSHPEPVRFLVIPAHRRWVYIGRLKAKLSKLGYGVTYCERGFKLVRQS